MPIIRIVYYIIIAIALAILVLSYIRYIKFRIYQDELKIVNKDLIAIISSFLVLIILVTLSFFIDSNQFDRKIKFNVPIPESVENFDLTTMLNKIDSECPTNDHIYLTYSEPLSFTINPQGKIINSKVSILLNTNNDNYYDEFIASLNDSSVMSFKKSINSIHRYLCVDYTMYLTLAKYLNRSFFASLLEYTNVYSSENNYGNLTLTVKFTEDAPNTVYLDKDIIVDGNLIKNCSATTHQGYVIRLTLSSKIPNQSSSSKVFEPYTILSYSILS